MGENEYKISLGVDIDVDDLQTKINIAGNKVKPIPIKVEIENLDEIKKQLQSLGGTKGNSKVAIPIDTASIEGALKDVKSIITEIKTSIGILDSKSGMKSLLSSINQISSALDKASDKFVELNGNLNAIASKDFNINFGINMGGSNQIARNAAYGNKARRETLPELQNQVAALEGYLQQYYKVTDGFVAAQKLVQGTGAATSGRTLLDIVPKMLDTSGSLSSQMSAYKEYISLIKDAASLKGVDLSHITSGFSKSADQLVQDAVDVQTGANEMQEGFEKLRQIFGGGNNFNVEGLSQQLDSIVVDLKEIKTALTDLSAETPLNKLGASFTELSNSITQLIQNCGNVNTAINEIGNTGANIGANVGNELANGFDSSMESVQASAAETSGVIENLKVTLETMKLDRSSIDAITKDIEELGFEVTNASVKMKDGNFDITVKGVDSFGKAITEMRRLDGESKEISGLGRTISQSFSTSDDVVRELNKEMANFVKLQSQIGNLQTKIGKLELAGGNENQVAELKKQLESLESTYDGLMQKFSKKLFSNSDIMPFDDVARFDNDIKAATDRVSNELNRLESEYNDTRVKLAQKIKLGLNDGDFNVISKITKDANQLTGTYPKLKAGVDEVKNALSAMEAAAGTDKEVADVEKLISAHERFVHALKNVNNQIRENKATEQNNAIDSKLSNDRLLFQNKIDAYLTKNSAAAKEFGAQLLKLKADAENCSRVKLDQLEAEFKQVDKAAEAAGVKTRTFGDSLKAQLSKYSSYLSVASMFTYVWQGMRDMFQQVVAIDTAMTELKKVTDETDASYNKFLTNAAKRSKELGTTIDGLVESTADFARLGYGFEDSQKLAEVANIYAVVGDEIEGVEDATQSLVSTLAAYKDEASGISDTDFAMDIVDKFNEVSNNFAISSGGIGEAMQRSASSLNAANNTLDESIALITAANTVVQDPAVVGTAFKTISMRIRGAKTELEEAGLETEGMVESTATLRAEIEALSGVDIMEADGKTFKSTYDILDELAQKWEDLSDIQQATVTELIAGKRQGNIISSLMTNFDTAREALETSLNSSGSAMKEHEKWQQSLEARLNKLKSTWQSLSQTFMSSGFLKATLNGVIGLVNGVDKLMDTLGTLPTLLGSVAAGLSLLKNKGFATFDKDAKSIQLFGNNILHLKSNLSKVSTAISTYNSNLSKSTGLQNAYIDAIGKQNNGLGKYLSGLNGAKASFGGYITSLIGAKVASIALQAATMALNAALTMGISALITWGIQGLNRLITTKKELAEQVEELTNKFKEQSDELKKLKGDYDTTNESSMISRYEKLSKGVDNLGRNVSLTADEYSEYQSIVNKIADRIPSLVSGYDSQGNAILSCKGNVEELTDAYEKLIHAQNTAILSNTKDIEKAYADSSNPKNGFFTYGGNRELENDSIKILEDVLENGLTAEEIKEKYNDRYNALEISKALEDIGIDPNEGRFLGRTDMFGGNAPIWEALAEAAETDPSQIKGIIDNYYAQFDEAVQQQKTIAQAKLSEAFDISSTISGLDYGNISEDLQAVAYQVVGSLDKDFFDKLQEDGKTVEQWTTEMLNQLNSIGKDSNAKIEAAFDLQTQFNGGEIPYGEYVDGLQNTGKLIDGLNLKDEVKSQLKLSLGLDEDGLVAEYKQLKNRLADNELFNIMPSDYEPFLEGLSAEELSVLIDIIPELSETDYKETIEDVKSALKKEMMLQGLTFDLNLEVETAGLEALNTALAESVSATGLSSESITALKGRYADLEEKGYDLSVLFEETSHGIHLNRQEFNKLEKAYATEKLADVNGDLEEMKVAYDDLGKAIKNTDDPVRKAELYNDRQTLAKRISEAATLAAQYEGLTSAYNDWLAAEEAGQERDMYENVIEGFENIGDEISRGWYDDGTIEFLEMLTGRTDLAGKSAKQLKEIYDGLDKSIKYIGEDGKVLEDTGYSVRDFFTVDDEGNATADGVYNFLDAIGKLEEEAFGGKDIVKRDKNGKVISFDFELAGGDEAVADALGISKELVQIMKRAADDAGFVVSLDGTYKQLADLQNEARESAEYLKSIGKTDFDFDFNTTNLTSLNNQLKEAKEILEDEDFWNKDGTFNFNADGATQAMQIVSTLQAKIDNLTEEKYGIGLTVEDEEFEEPLENLQEYGRTIQTLNQLKLNPKANAEEIKELEGDLKEISEYFANLDGETKVKLGFDADDNWEEVKTKIEKGEVKIPTVLDIQANMDKNIETLADLALLGSGLLSEDEEEAIVKKYKIEAKADEVDTSDVEEKVDNAVIDGLGNPILSREANIEIIAETFGIEDVDDLSSKLEGLDDKTIQAIAEAVGKGDVDALQIAVEGMDGNTVQAIAEALGYSDVESLKTAVNNMQGKTVDAEVNTDGQQEKVNTFQSWIDGLRGKSVVIDFVASGIEKIKELLGVGEVNGTANVNGTAFADGTTDRAFKRGNWGTKSSGTALMGELGRKIFCDHT